MPLVGAWTDSTGNGYTYPNAYLVAHERLDTIRQTVLIDVKIWASSGLVGHTPIYAKTLVPTTQQITALMTLIEGRVDEALKTKAMFSGMSTTA